MQTGGPLIGRYIVNGIKSELTIDSNSIIWSVIKTKHEGSKRIRDASLNRSNSLNHQPDLNSKNNKRVHNVLRRINLKNVIGIKSFPLPSNCDKVADRIHFETQKRQHKYEINQCHNDIDEQLCNKIKVYYAKEARNRSTTKLLKLKKLTIEPISKKQHQQELAKRQTLRISKSLDEHRQKLVSLNHNNPCQDDSTDGHKQQQELLAGRPLSKAGKTNYLQSQSGPPSCYASEGSYSHLSSLSAASSLVDNRVIESHGGANNDSASLSPKDRLTQQHQHFASCIDIAKAVKTASATARSTTTTCEQHYSTAIAKSSPTLNELAKYIQTLVELSKKSYRRPQRLLVFVNPFGGKGRASKVFKNRVCRLMELAQIEVRLITTKHANHARDSIEDLSFDIEYYDGIVCVGGDGMFSELMNGLLFRYNREKILTARLELDKRNEILNSAEVSDTSKSSDINIDSNGKGSIGGPSAELKDNITASGEQQRHQPDSYQNHHRLAREDDNKRQSDSTNKRQQQRDGTIQLTDLGSIDDDNTNINVAPSKMTSPDSRQNSVAHDKRLLEALKSALGGIGQQFVSPPIPIGVIGAGSTDANSFGLIGTNDVITATLNIILGNQINIDVCSIHSLHDDKWIKFVSTFVAYGYFGDVIRESEKLRWLGPSRYDVTGFNNLIKNRSYNGKVKILRSNLDGSPKDLQRCHNNCPQCKSSTRRKLFDDLKLELVEQNGPFIGVNAAVTACRCPQTKKGFSPNNHLANGCADLILVRPCTRVQYIQYLLRTGWTKKSAFDLKYVNAFRCRQFEFHVASDDSSSGLSDKLKSSTASSTASTASSSSSTSVNQSINRALSSSVLSSSGGLDSSKYGQFSSTLSSDTSGVGGSSKSSTIADSDNLSSWNVDGEILNEQSIRVKVNNQLLKVFGTGEPLL